MLPKKNRADKKLVETIFKKGRFVNSTGLSFKFILNSTPKRQISVIVPKNIAKLASERNALRRAGYVVLGQNLDKLPTGITGAVIFKKPLKILEIDNEIKNILDKIN